MRTQPDGGGFPQRLDFAPVRERVAECDDVRGAAEVCDKTNDTAKANLSELINTPVEFASARFRNKT
jgi:hypothetical protein